MESIEAVLADVHPARSILIIDGGVKSSILMSKKGWRKVVFFDTGKYYPESIEYAKGLKNVEVVDTTDEKDEKAYKRKVQEWAEHDHEVIYGGGLEIEGLENPLAASNIIEIWTYVKENKIGCCPLYERGIQNVGDPFAAVDEELSEAQKAEMEQRLKDMGYM